MDGRPAGRIVKAVKPLFRSIFIIVALSAILLILDKLDNRENERKYRFGLIQYNDTPLSEMSRSGIIEGLAQYGYQKEKDYELLEFNAQGDVGSLNMMIDAVINKQADLVFITSTPTLQAAIKKIKTIPVVFSVVADPILAGAGTSFENHLPNLTGISTLGDFEGMVKWVRKILPGATKLGTIYTPGETNSVKNMTELKKYAELAGLKLLTVPVNSSQEIMDACLSLCNQNPDVICQIVDNLSASAASSIISTAGKNGIPVFGFVSDQAKKGAVFVVSRDYHQAGVDAVKLAVRILKGENPAKISFEFVSKTNLLINPAAAKTYGILLPKEITQNTDVVVIQ
jgi:ABC-type uncharacterized transport system substrate-binding protein